MSPVQTVHYASSRNPLLRADGLSKVFPGTLANDSVSIDFLPGVIHALLGENGAGKSTLVGMLYGVHQPDRGRLYWKGRPVALSSPAAARHLGIAMVHQHISLIPSFTVLENLLLQLPAGPGRQHSEKRVRERLKELCSRFELDIDADAPVHTLPMGTRQVIDILKALFQSCELLILDEPTAVLTPGETDRLFGVMRQLRSEGCAIILIAHKIREVLDICDCITVLRDGRKVGHRKRQDASVDDLARMMVGRRVEAAAYRPARTSRSTDPLVVLDKLRDHRTGRESLKGLSLALHGGEVVGVAGIDGNGQRTLFEVLSARRDGFTGTCRILGMDPREVPRSRFLQAPVAFVPEDRHHTGLILGMSVAENVVLQACSRRPFARPPWWLRPGRWRAFARESVDRYGIRVASVDQPVAALSGGNQQKVLLARELSRNPRFLVLANPTRGLDIAAIQAVHGLIREARDRGCAILLVSSDLDEILALSDRIAVLHAGRFLETVERSRADVQRIGLLMAGEQFE